MQGPPKLYFYILKVECNACAKNTVEPRLSESRLSEPSIMRTLELCVLLEYLPIYCYNCKFVTWPTFITIIQH